MTTTIHRLAAGTERTDEHGSYADAACGAVGSYYTTDPAGITCDECRVITQPGTTRYEVTVPLVVTVEIDDDHTHRITRAHLDPSYAGFHGEAESASGVWDPDGDGWGCANEDDPAHIQRIAWRWTQQHVTAVAIAEVIR